MAHKLFLGGLSPSTRDETIREHFSKFGRVADAVVMRDRGFGFVTFESQSGADAALAQPHQTIDGQTVDVKQAVGKSGGGGGGGGRGGAGGSSGKHDPGGVTDKVFVGGLPQDCADDKIRRYFEVYGTIVDAVVMKDRETNRSRGFGFVQFDNPYSVDKVMADYSTHKIEGKWVEVKRSIPRDQMPPSENPPSRGRGSGGGGGGHRDRESSRDSGGDRGSGSGGPGHGPPPGKGGYGYDYGMPPPGYGGAYMGGPCGYPGGYGYNPYGGYGGAYGGYGGGYGMPPPSGYGHYPMDPYGGYPGYPPQGPPPAGKGGRPGPY